MKKALLFAILSISIACVAQNDIPKLDSKGNIQYNRNADQLKKFDGNIFKNKKNGQKMQQVNTLALRDSSYYWSWDTTIHNWTLQPYAKAINYVYNSNDYITSLLRQTWNGSNWVNSGQYFYTYDTNNNNLSNYGQFWNGSTWLNSYKNIYTYDANNNQTAYLSQNGNGSSWVNYEQELNTYDSNNNRLSYLKQTWNGNSWDNVNQEIYTYDPNNNMISQLYKSWNGNSWDDIFRTNWTYDSNNNNLSGLTENWTGFSWDNSSLDSNTFDSNNNWISYLGQLWNGTNWYKWRKSDKFYDINNKKIHENYFNWNNGMWENSNQNFYTWGLNNTIVSHSIYQNWGGITWVNSSEQGQSFDANGFLQSEMHKFWDISGTLVTLGDSTYHYSHITTGIGEAEVRLNALVFYPNPTNSTLSISSTLNYHIINIVNSIGQTVLVNDNKSEPVTVATLPTGVYLIQLLDKKGTLLKTEKFIKE